MDKTKGSDGFIYVVQMNIPAEHEERFNTLYDTEHLPRIVAVPGVRKCTRFKLEQTSNDGVPTYLAIYEVDAPEVVGGPQWKEASDFGEWLATVRPFTKDKIRSIYRPRELW